LYNGQSENVGSQGIDAVQFEYPEDRAFFEELLCQPGEDLTRYAHLFDFRPVPEKRRDFGKIRDRQLKRLIEHLGCICQLEYAPDCDPSSGQVLDHLIPLASNDLNKKLRGLRTSRESGKLRKVPSQSFGSNHPENLVLSCVNCNSRKKHRVLNRKEVSRALKLKAARLADQATVP
jgi:5-methylcytosine-specific restriction endonuclease McrA